MAKLTYSMMASLDGYINDAKGDFNWGQINEAVHRHANEEARRQGTEIYGRRMYETMVAWETLAPDNNHEAEFQQIWRGNDKLVVSRSLKEVASERTRLVPRIAIDEMERLKAESAKDLSVSGPTLASAYLDAGLVDEVGIYYVPVVVGSGTPMFKQIDRKLQLERLEEQAFGNGVLFVRYRVRD